MDFKQVLNELRKDHEKAVNAVSALNNLGGSRAIAKALGAVQQERMLIEDAVVAIEDLARSRKKSRGRRAGWILAIRESIAQR